MHVQFEETHRDYVQKQKRSALVIVTKTEKFSNECVYTDLQTNIESTT